MSDCAAAAFAFPLCRLTRETSKSTALFPFIQQDFLPLFALDISKEISGGEQGVPRTCAFVLSLFFDGVFSDLCAEQKDEDERRESLW